MEIRQLQLFVALAEEKSFTKAAKRMHIVQSGLSNSLKELEQDLGVQLCERSTRRVTFTRDGEAFLEHARAVLIALDDARQSVAPSNAEVRGQMYVGVMDSCSAYVSIADLLDRFQKTFPQVQVQFRRLNSNGVIQCVRSGAVDISFYAKADERLPEGIEFLPYRKDSLVALCSVDHPFADLQTVSLEQLSREAFVDASREKTLRQLVDQIFKKAGLKRQSAFEVDSPLLCFDLVEKNLGVSIVQAALAEKFGANRHVRSIPLSAMKPRFPSWHLGLVRKRHRRLKPGTDPVKHFVNMLFPHSAYSPS